MKTPARRNRTPVTRERGFTLLAADWRTGETSEYEFRGSRLVGRAPKRGRTDLLSGPGFFDLQNNGYAGVDFNGPKTTPEEIVRGIRATWQHGCTHLLPTLITQTPERLEHLFRNLMKALALDEDVRQSVPGFHMEGPFISPEDGARGAHPLHAVSPISATIWKRLQRATEQQIKLTTLAPEWKGAPAFIRRLREEKVLPAIGHTMANVAQVQAAAEAGAIMTTHLGNGCPQMLHRHHNPVSAQLGEDRIAASLITDGIHLPPEIVKAYYRGKEPHRSVVVTDSMSAAGAPPGLYPLSDYMLEVGADRVVRQPGSPNFAGSALTMDRAVSGLKTMAEIGWTEAWEAASTRPWELLRKADPKAATPKTATTFVIARVTDTTLDVVATVRDRKVLWTEVE
jgi:N-acetylglucosamine-6-phosphate deacetylase